MNHDIESICRELLDIQGDMFLAIRCYLSDKDKPISQRELARRMTLAQPTMRSLERGEKVPGRRVICKLTEYLSDTQMRAYLNVLHAYEQAIAGQSISLADVASLRLNLHKAMGL